MEPALSYRSLLRMSPREGLSEFLYLRRTLTSVGGRISDVRLSIEQDCSSNKLSSRSFSKYGRLTLFVHTDITAPDGKSSYVHNRG